MRLFDVDDIRVFWSDDERVTSQFENFDGDFASFKFVDPKKNIEPKPFDTAMWITGGFEISRSSFSRISYFLERILMEHIELNCSLDSELTFISICSIKIPSRNRDIFD